MPPSLRRRCAGRPFGWGSALLLLVALSLVASSASVLVVTAAPRPTSASLGTVSPVSESVRSVSHQVPSGANSSYWEFLGASTVGAPSARSMAQAAYFPALNATILFGGYNGEGGNLALGDTWEYRNFTWTELSAAGGPSPRWSGSLVYDPSLGELVLFGGRNVTSDLNDTWAYNASGWQAIPTVHAPPARQNPAVSYDAADGELVLFGGGVGNLPAGTFTPLTYYNDTWTFRGTDWTNITSSAGPAPAGRLVLGQMAYDAADGYLLLTGGYDEATPSCGAFQFEATFGQTWEFGGGRWSQLAPAGISPPPGAGTIWYDSAANTTLYYEGLEINPAAGSGPGNGSNASGSGCTISTNEVWSFAGGAWTEVTAGAVRAPAPRILTVAVDDVVDRQQIVFGGMANNSSYLADTWALYPNGSAPTPPLVANSSWQNVTYEVGPAPSPRNHAQTAFSPALNATILFGGYNGNGGNFPLGDTWEYRNSSWTELQPSGGPSPRWSGSLVYDPALRALVLFGGRNVTADLNDTWIYNASGWHRLPTAHAPPARQDPAVAYDAADGEIVLFGGGVGNLPAGTFTTFTYYNDTWAFRGTDWVNLTATAGTPPAGRLVDGQMAYDAADGYLLLTGGYAEATAACGIFEFDAVFGQTWRFVGGAWSQITPTGSSPAPGAGTIWFDSEANLTLYYQGLQANASACQSPGNTVWSYAAGTWTLVTEPHAYGPGSRILSSVVDDPVNHQQVVFGGIENSTLSVPGGFASYLGDTWVYRPTWITFDVAPLPASASVRVVVGSDSAVSHGGPLVFVEAPGTYGYSYLVRASGTAVSAIGWGSLSLNRTPALVLIPVTLPGGGGGAAAPTAPGVQVVAGAFAAAATGGLLGAAVVVRQRRLVREAEELLAAMQASDEGTERWAGRK